MKMTKTKRDQMILNLLTKFKVCSRNQIATLIFINNANPINVCNRVLKRLTMNGQICQIQRTKDQTYLYTLNPSPINHRSNKIEHHLKIVDFFIKMKYPKHFAVEPILGDYEPDILMKDSKGNTICVEIQITPISNKKMQQKVNEFVSMYGKEHDSKTMILSSNQNYPKLRMPNGFKLVKQNLPSE